jgi:hypothetical protein
MRLNLTEASKSLPRQNYRCTSRITIFIGQHNDDIAFSSNLLLNADRPVQWQGPASRYRASLFPLSLL